MSDEPIDFSALDPTADRARFDARVGDIAKLAAQRGVRLTLAMQIVALWRVALLGAAGTALACWAITVMRPPPAVMPAREALLSWAAHDDVTSRATLLASLEVHDEH